MLWEVDWFTSNQDNSDPRPILHNRRIHFTSRNASFLRYCLPLRLSLCHILHIAFEFRLRLVSVGLVQALILVLIALRWWRWPLSEWWSWHWMATPGGPWRRGRRQGKTASLGGPERATTAITAERHRHETWTSARPVCSTVRSAAHTLHNIMLNPLTPTVAILVQL